MNPAPETFGVERMRTLVVCSNPLDPVTTRLRSIVRAKVDPEGPAVTQVSEFDRRFNQSQAELLLVVLPSDFERGIEVIRKARRLMHGFIIAVGPVFDPKAILRTLQEGADHFVDEADLDHELEAALARLQNKDEKTGTTGRVIGVLGASGGSGASTLAVNIAATLAQENSKCALVDLKPGRGDLATLLDLKPGFTLADVCINAARVDRPMFEKMLTPHPSGIHLLAAPQVFGDTRLVTSPGVSQALTMARRLFPFVVVDLEDCFHQEQLLALQQASAILLVSRLDFTSIRNMRRILDYLQENNIQRNLVRLVINRFGQPNELPADEAEEALGGRTACYIPDDPKTINASNNIGQPAVLKFPQAKVTKTIIDLAHSLIERRKEERPVKKSFFSSLVSGS